MNFSSLFRCNICISWFKSNFFILISQFFFSQLNSPRLTNWTWNFQERKINRRNIKGILMEWKFFSCFKCRFVTVPEARSIGMGEEIDFLWDFVLGFWWFFCGDALKLIFKAICEGFFYELFHLPFQNYLKLTFKTFLKETFSYFSFGNALKLALKGILRKTFV